MHAGIPGAGAEDAWYCAALQFETWQAKLIAAVGGSIDIFKCFDQIIGLYFLDIVRLSPKRVGSLHELPGKC